MCAAESARERDPRSATRIYHSHSRSRQLLSLPISPAHLHKAGDFRSARNFASSKSLARVYPTSRFVRTLALLAVPALAFAVLQHFAQPSFYVSVAGGREGRGLGETVVVERPTVVGESNAGVDEADVPTTSGGNDTVLKQLTEGEGKRKREETVVGEVGFESKSVIEGESTVQRDDALVDTEETTSESTQGGGAGIDEGRREGSEDAAVKRGGIPEERSMRVETIVEVGDNSAQELSNLDEEAQKARELLFRDPADFSTFTENTALNYFHLHKTGGVSFKERLFDFFILYEKLNRKGLRAKVVDTCHMSGPVRPALGIEAQWSCDWGEIETMPEEERNKIDVVLGHQYWERGAGYWVPNRDLRYFTVMRHPLHRKVSFFYHFFVRNAGRSEESVTENELIQFVLGNDMPSSPLVRDAGPSYYASRLWSDGLLGYGDYNNFIVPDEKAGAIVFNSIRRLRRNFVFIGLQTQEKASLCMLQKTVEAFAKAHGFNNLSGLDEISKHRERLNTGSYPLSAKILWNKMTKKQKDEFKRVERVDLAIYRESVKMFREMVKKFYCEEFVVDTEEDTIAT